VRASDRIAVIDIGSNSIRLVVYSGSPRAPAVVFNEKVLAGLGEKLGETGMLPAKAQTRALAALERFQLLVQHMGAKRVRTVATAAVRDASNGSEFVQQVERIGLQCEVLSARQEAWLAGEGVLSAIPGADGIVGDLGGGSLELVEVGEGRVNASVSLPIGVLRVKTSKLGEAAAAAAIRAGLQGGIGKNGRGRTLYLVGGSWRAVARLDMTASDYPLPITHEYRMAPSRPRLLRRLAEELGPKLERVIPPGRVPTMPAAAMILSCLTDELRPSELVVSSFGIREGLLYEGLTPAQRSKDPLIEAARDASIAARRFEEHGDALDRWISPVFDDGPELARLRLASCILADAAWQAHPDFRAERGVDLALHGNWVGADASARVLIAQALFSNFGAQELLPDGRLIALCKPDEVERAHQWGLAMQLGQRLCGGVAAALRSTRLSANADVLELSVSRSKAALAGETVERRLVRLAQAMGKKPLLSK
jgi:exopolyphosphatase / guanosine-5'-triphosphate,3'-diphosphate pyrophosphatase